MAQGKMKVKSKKPEIKKNKMKKKGSVFTQRANKPVAPKKCQFQEGNKLKKAVTKAVNKAVESEIRDRALPGQKTFSKAQEAVAAHHKKIADSASTSQS